MAPNCLRPVVLNHGCATELSGVGVQPIVQMYDLHTIRYTHFKYIVQYVFDKNTHIYVTITTNKDIKHFYHLK